ncbi:MAG: hypothetical protein AAFZ99_01370 [Pseudomonadota bacterium]
MPDKTVTLLLKHGEALQISATEEQSQFFFKQFADHVKDPAKQTFIGGSYKNGGDLRLLAEQVAGIAAENE